MPFPLQHTLRACKSRRQTKGNVVESDWVVDVQVLPVAAAVRQGEQISVEAFVRYRDPEVIVRTDSELEPAAMLHCDFNGYGHLLQKHGISVQGLDVKVTTILYVIKKKITNKTNIVLLLLKYI